MIKNLKKLSPKIIASVYIAIILFVTAHIIWKSKQQKAEKENLISGLLAETRQYRNENNHLVSENLALVGDKKQLKQLAEYLKRKGDTITAQLTSKTREVDYLKKEIRINGSGRMTPVDTTLVIGGTTVDTARFLIDSADAYHSFRFAGNYNRYAYELKFFDHTEILKETTKDGTLVRVINHSPYVVTSEVKSLMIPERKPSLLKKGVWAGIGAAAAVLIMKL